MARKSMVVVIRKKNDPDYVKVFTNHEEALAFVGPEYDKQGYRVDAFERKTETYFEPISFDGMAMDKTENGRKLSTTHEDGGDNVISPRTASSRWSEDEDTYE